MPLLAAACLVNTPGYGLDGGEGGSSESSDESGDTGATSDVAPDVGGGGVEGCNELWHAGLELEVPEALAILNSASHEMDPFLSADGMTLYFASAQAGGPGGIDLWQATRAGIDEPFGAPVLNMNVASSAGHEVRYVPVDGLTAFVIAQWQGGAGDHDIWRADRAVETEPFEGFEPVAELNTAAAEYDITLVDGGRRIYWTRVDGGAQTLFTAERPDPDGIFGPPEPVEVDSPVAYDDSPAVSQDQLVIVFGSDRPGGVGGHDLWYATRDDAEDPFGVPVPLPTVNSPESDAEAHVTADGCELFFVSDRAGGAGEWDLYRSRVIEP